MSWLNCPHCNSKELGDTSPFGTGFVVVCENCECLVYSDISQEDADEKWNTRASQWQPIETAPQDESTILLLTIHGCREGFVDSAGSVICPKDYLGLPCETFYDIDEISHWQPLPEPPK